VTQPTPPRAPLLDYWVIPLNGPTTAVIRLSWFSGGRVRRVEEFCVLDADNAVETVQEVFSQAMDTSLDLSIATPHLPEDLGLELTYGE
jgi:hypothetical protein